MPRTSTTPHSATSEPLATPTAETRRRMQRQRRRDTKPELALRRALHARGWRFRVDIAPLPGLRRRADVVFTRHRVAVYVDGCFWHSCPTHRTIPKNNHAWWVAKLLANVERDRDTERRLQSAGWITIRLWEHTALDEAIASVEAALPHFSERREPQGASRLNGSAIPGA